jgi:hypothetical protein
MKKNQKLLKKRCNKIVLTAQNYDNKKIFYVILYSILALNLKKQIDKVSSLDAMPIFKGYLSPFIQSNIKYLESAIRDSLEGMVKYPFLLLLFLFCINPIYAQEVLEMNK